MSSAVEIEIQNLPEHITREDLIRIFENELKGGNKIRYLLFPVSGGNRRLRRAFISFDVCPDNEFTDRLLERNPCWSIKLNSRMQAYSCCYAEVDSAIVAAIPDIPECIAMLKKDYGIEGEYNKNSGKLLLKGTMIQLQYGEEKLGAIFKEQMTLQRLEFLEIGKTKSSYSNEFDTRPTFSSFGKTPDRESARGRDVELYETHGGGFRDNDDVITGKNRQGEEYEYSGNSVSPIGRGSRGLAQKSDEEPLRTRLDKNLMSARSDAGEWDGERYAHNDGGFFSLPYIPDSSGRNVREIEDRPVKLFTRIGDSVDDNWTSRHRPLTERHEEVLRGVELKQQFHSPDRENMPYEHSEIRHLSEKMRDADVVRDRETSLDVRSRSTDLSEAQERSELRTGSGNTESSAFWKEKLDGTSDVYASGVLPSSHSYHALASGDLDNKKSSGIRESTSYTFETRGSVKAERTPLPSGKEFDEPPELPTVSSEDGDAATLFLESHVIKYLMVIEKIQVNSIKRRYGVDIEVISDPGSDISTVVFRGQGMKKASEKFAKLYEEVFNDIVQRDVLVNPDLPEVLDEIKRIRLLNAESVVLVTVASEKVTVLGQFLDVMKVVDRLNRVKTQLEIGRHDKAFGRREQDTESKTEMRAASTVLDEMLDIKKPNRSDRTSAYDDGDDSKVVPQSKDLASLASDRRVSATDTSLPLSEDEFKSSAALTSDLQSLNSPAVWAVPGSGQFEVMLEDTLQVLIYTGDITMVKVDAIVNAANSFLANVAGVAGAIEEAGGPQFRKECENLYYSNGPLKVGEVVHTSAHGKLLCKYVIHTVAPQWFSHSKPDKFSSILQTMFENVLEYAAETLQTKSITVPAVGTGFFGIPLDICARAMYFALHQFLEQRISNSILKTVHIVNKDPGTTEMIQAVFEGLQLLQKTEWKKDTDENLLDDAPHHH